jgi:hypothetical protein
MSNKLNPKKMRVASRPKLKTFSKDFSDQEEREKFNENIGHLDKSLENISIIGKRGILARMYQFTKPTMSDGKLIDTKFLSQTSSNGQVTAELDDIKWRQEAVICSISPSAQKEIDEIYTPEEAAKIVPGATIWVTKQSANYGFTPSREYPINTDYSFLCLNPQHIEAVVDAPLKEIKYI